jgi:hypothetical protein
MLASISATPGNGSMTNPPDTGEAVGELAFLLRHAGIAVPAERWDAIVAEYIAFRPHIALVNQALRPEDEPAPVFKMQPANDRR